MSSYTELQSTQLPVRQRQPIQRDGSQAGHMQNRKVRRFVETGSRQEIYGCLPKFAVGFVACGVGMLACEILSGEGGFTYLIWLAPGLLFYGNSITPLARCITYHPKPINFSISSAVEGKLIPLEGRAALQIPNSGQLDIPSGKNYLILKQGEERREFREGTTCKKIHQVFQYITSMYLGLAAGLFVFSFGDCGRVTKWGSDNQILIYGLINIFLAVLVCTKQKRSSFMCDLDQLAIDNPEGESTSVQVEEV